MDALRTITPLFVLSALAASASAAEHRFDDDVAFLKKHTSVVLLADPASGARVAVTPAWQGRVMTSTAGSGSSYGWINEELIASGRQEPHMNALGGEDRFWLGPEGGQFSVFFRGGAPFDLEHWQTPPLVDTEVWNARETGPRHVAFVESGRLVNYAGTVLQVRIERTVRLLDRSEASEALGVRIPPGASLVAFESENTLVNAGEVPWTKRTGLPSIWILGMFQPSPLTTVVVPFRAGPADVLGPVVNDAYFGKVPSDRLVERDGVLYFKGDGRYRSKIGLSPARARTVLGSYDAARHVLTLVSFDRPKGANDYVNSMWEIQRHPFRGDVVNSYNDGPASPGAKPLGPFYELETSSPALALAPGERATHVHRTVHVEGAEKELDALARGVLGVGLDDIRKAFTQ